ncbi:MAG: PepSY-associated TM helix domain-containing protein, partial [Terriglobus sp.]
LRYVYFNQWTGQVVQDRLRYGSVMGWFENLHYYLLSGRTGLMVSGWMAVGLFLLCVSGIVIWWPGITRWTAALVLRRRGSWKRLNWDLHSVIGFWSSLALSSVVFTGVYFAFSVPIAGAIVKLTGGSISKALTFVAVPKALPVKPGTPTITLDQALVLMNAALRPAPPTAYLQLPVGPQGVYGGLSYYPGSLKYTELRRASIDPHTGAVLSTADTHDMEFGMHVVQYFHTVHFGTFGGNGWFGIAVRCLWVLVGLTPALLAITGLIMYWNRKLGPMIRRASMR